MNSPTQLHTERLTMIAATLEHVRIELEAPQQLGALLDAQVSPAWPTGEYDRDAMEFFRVRLEAGGKEVEGWYGWYAIRRGDAQVPQSLVGAGGYFGPPDSEGVVEIGYSVLPEWQRMGYATEIVHALLERAFHHEQITKVIAHTSESNPGSIGVLLRSGFVAAGQQQEVDSLRFERRRTPRVQKESEGDGFDVSEKREMVQPPITIVEVPPDSADAVQLINELDDHLMGLPYTPESRHAFSVDKLVREGVAFFIARKDGELAGCAGVKLFGIDYGEVKRMYVRPAYRGLGLGKLMLNRLAEYARERQVSVLRLETGIYQTEAIGLYERYGFQRRPPFGEYKEDPLSVYFEKPIA